MNAGLRQCSSGIKPNSTCEFVCFNILSLILVVNHGLRCSLRLFYKWTNILNISKRLFIFDQLITDFCEHLLCFKTLVLKQFVFRGNTCLYLLNLLLNFNIPLLISFQIFFLLFARTYRLSMFNYSFSFKYQSFKICNRLSY